MELLTIGHSNHEADRFITLLQQHGVTALADVRSHPYSRYLSHFNQAPLKSLLQEANIRYVFLGDQLGARPRDPQCYVDGKAVYARIAATPQFKAGIQRILQGLKTYKIALMCAEKDPITCHRAILVCHQLQQFNLNIQHILKNGELETHQQLEERLLRLHNLSVNSVSDHQQFQLGLFDQEMPKTANEFLSRDIAIATAYELQGDQIAYVEKTEERYEQAG